MAETRSPVATAKAGVGFFNKYIAMDKDEAEDAVLSSVEQRAKYTQVGEDGFRPAVRGEFPPLRVPNLGVSMQSSIGSTKRSSTRSIQAASEQYRMRGAAFRHKKNLKGGHKGRHRRAHTLLADMGEDESDFGFGFKDSPDIAKTFRDYDISGSDTDERTDDLGTEDDEIYPHEGLPLLNGYSENSLKLKKESERKLKARKLLKKNGWKKLKELLNPTILVQRLFNWFVHSTLIVAIPLFISAFILFYVCGNPPTPEYIPGNVNMSWWFDFAGRQLLMLELARFSQTIIIDGLVLTSKSVVKALGPWLIIFCIQSKGWPFITAAWGLWDLILLQGDSKFDKHWLYSSGFQIYSDANSGAYILNSEYYLRILFCMILFGLAITLKSTMITLYFSRRMVDTYKTRLEEILNDIITITEVAELAIESESIANLIGIEHADSLDEPLHEAKESTAEARRRGRLGTVRWSDVKFQSDDSSIGNSETNKMPLLGENINDDEDSLPIDLEFDIQGDQFFEKEKLYGSSSRRIAMKDLLDKWDEPVERRDKSLNVSVADVMKFRQALSYMDLDYPFSEAFGLASTRNETILSAESVYTLLMKLSPDPDTLCFSVFDILLLQEDGTEDKNKKKRLKNVFHPNLDGSIKLVSFVQACDTLYRNLRLFRASVGNSSVIDCVLESLIDPIFFFCLVTIVLTLLKFDPMAMLIPLSSLLVAGSFSFGPTCAKAFEGIILVTGLRPYGIGDRIVITDSAGSAVPEMGMSWIVEDISVFSTTLRFGASNEIATVSNGSIAGARITNCSRSEKATIHILLHFHMSCHEGKRAMEMFKEGVEEYVREHPNRWDSIFLFRCENIDPKNEEVIYRLAVRSMYTWQVSNKVYRHRGELHQFCTSLSFKLHINYDSPDTRSVMYYGGSLINGGVEDYKNRVLRNSNISNEKEDNILTGTIIPTKSSHDSTSIADSKKQAPDPLTKVQKETHSRTKSSITGEGNIGDIVSSISESPWNDEDTTFLSMLQGSHM